jgi:hypothetical protein
MLMEIAIITYPLRVGIFSPPSGPTGQPRGR